MQEIEKELLNVLFLVISTLIAAAGGFLINFLKTNVLKEKLGAESIKDENQRKLVTNALERLQQVAYQTIISTQNTVIKALKDASADGKVDKAELEAVAVDVRNKIIAQISPQIADLIKSEIGDIEEYVKHLIEVQLLYVKQSPELNPPTITTKQ